MKKLDFYLRIKGGMFIIRGASMYPTLKESWRVKVEPLMGTEIKTKDIILFNNYLFVCHRVVGKARFFRRNYVIHKGDNASIGGIIDADNLIGRVENVFDETGQKIAKKEWKEVRINGNTFIWHIYVFMYLIKKFVFGNKTNITIKYINKIFWFAWLLRLPHFLLLKPRAARCGNP